jgi:hypothetical protein
VNDKDNKGVSKMKISTEVLYTNGIVDEDATLEAFTSELSSIASSHTASLSTVAEGVGKFFQANPGNTPMPTVASLVASALGTSREDFAKVQALVADYIRSNADGNGTDTYHVGRGRKDGGVSLKA